MEPLKIGRYIQRLRKEKGMTQKDLADKLGVSFQAVSKWENGDSLPDTGLLLDLSDLLETTVDKLLNAGVFAANERRVIHTPDVITGFHYMEEIGRIFGKDSTFFTGMVEGINQKMNIDLLTYLGDPMTREVLYAEAIIQAILFGKTVDMDEVEAMFQNKKMVGMIRKYLNKAAE